MEDPTIRSWRCNTKVMLTDKTDLVFTDQPWNVNYGGVKEDNTQRYQLNNIEIRWKNTLEWTEVFYILKVYSSKKIL